MKTSFCSILTAVILIFSQGMTASAAAMPNPLTDPFAAQNSARSTISLSFQGSSYTTTQETILCQCELSAQHVEAATAKSNSTVTILSKAYNSLGTTATIGSDGNAAANTVHVSYNTSTNIKYTYQEHGASSTIVKIILTRY